MGLLFRVPLREGTFTGQLWREPWAGGRSWSPHHSGGSLVKGQWETRQWLQCMCAVRLSWGTVLRYSWTTEIGQQLIDIHPPLKDSQVLVIIGYFFSPVVMYGYESLTTKKAEWWRIDAFELWYWKRFLTVPWTVRKSNQSVLKDIRPEYSLEGVMLKLKLQYFSRMMQRADSLAKTLMLGKIEGGRRRGQQRMRWLDGITNSMDHQLNGHEFEWTPGVGDGQGSLAFCSPWGRKETQLSDWTELELVNWGFSFLSLSLFIYKMSMIIVSITYGLGKITYGKCLTQGLTYKNAQKCLLLLLSLLTFWCIPLLLDILLYTVV